MTQTLEQIVSKFGQATKAKLGSASVQGEPEDQLRTPFEHLLLDLAELAGVPRGKVIAVGETRLAEQHIRPDYAVTVHGALAGFVEVKAPGKGADPRRFKGEHDKAQWKRLQSLPNLLYTDGSEFSLWRNGERIGEIVRLDGDIETAGATLRPGPGLQSLFEAFLGWQPMAPRTARELAQVSARLCRLLHDEVVEALARRTEPLTTLAADWRNLLFPHASDEQFADGYAQAVTFGLLMARARGITIGGDLHRVAEGLADTASLIGAALQLLTDNRATRQALATSLGTLERVLDVVDWPTLSKGRGGDAWLYFYEDFLEIYDNTLRKQTGSYYTPPEVVGAMVALVDEALRRPGFGLAREATSRQLQALPSRSLLACRTCTTTRDGGGRTIPLWEESEARRSNVVPAVLSAINNVVGREVKADSLFAYIAALTAHPGYVERFRKDLATPGLRIPLTADPALFDEAVALGRRVIWLHTFGERFADAAAGREPGPPRLPAERRTRVPKEGAIPTDAEHMPDSIGYDAAHQRLLVGRGYIEPVPPAVWHYEVSGKQVLVQWFSYRKKSRERPMIGDRRPPSPLGDIQPDTWLAEYTTELLNVLNVLGLLVDLEPAQAELLRRICEGPTIPASALPLGPAAGHRKAGAESADAAQAGLDFGSA